MNLFHRQNNNDDDSGRSTPEHLKKYSGSAAFSDNANNCNGTTGSNSAQAAENSRRLRSVRLWNFKNGGS